MNKKKKKVLVGMSGGVDSSVTACLLKQEGYEVVGVHMRFWVEQLPAESVINGKLTAGDTHRENRCCSIESWENAAKVCKQLGIDFKVLNLEEEFKEEIVDYYLKEQSMLLTPNPCVECNRRIKFGKFLELLPQFEADFVATGHYVSIIKNTVGDKNIYELHAASDQGKDQSYFLYTLTQEKLARILFPLGQYNKTQVREMAKKFGIDFINQKPESQNLCFIPEKDPHPFLQRNLDPGLFRHGPIKTTEGIIIGEHQGLPFYTIGQRKGIGIGGLKNNGATDAEPWYVVGFNKKENALIVGGKESLYSQSLILDGITFIGDSVEGNVDVKIRYRGIAQPASLKLLSRSRAEVQFEKPVRAVTPGQSAVFYRGSQVLGGGIISVLK